MTQGGEFDEEEMEFTDEESMTESDNSMGSVDSHGIPKPRDEAGPGVKIDLKMANRFPPTKTQSHSKPDLMKSLGDKLSAKVVDELRDNVQYVTDFDKHLTENKIDDINP